jgi:predicted DNA-binding transcriptional regulator AlpA
MNDDLTGDKVPANSESRGTPEELWTTRKVAKFLHVSIKTIFNLRKTGLPFVQLGGAVRFVPQEIRDYLTNSRRLSFHRTRQLIRERKLSHD